MVTKQLLAPPRRISSIGDSPNDIHAVHTMLYYCIVEIFHENCVYLLYAMIPRCRLLLLLFCFFFVVATADNLW